MNVTCKHCDREWGYQGDKEYPAMVTCPDCYNKVRLPDEENNE